MTFPQQLTDTRYGLQAPVAWPLSLSELANSVCVITLAARRGRQKVHRSLCHCHHHLLLLSSLMTCIRFHYSLIPLAEISNSSCLFLYFPSQLSFSAFYYFNQSTSVLSFPTSLIPRLLFNILAVCLSFIVFTYICVCVVSSCPLACPVSHKQEHKLFLSVCLLLSEYFLYAMRASYWVFACVCTRTCSLGFRGN